MIKPVRITPKADSDIDSCFAWIKRENPQAAIKFLDAVELTCRNLSQTPSIGSRRYADVPLVRGVRVVAVKGFKNNFLFFMENETTIDIIRVVHGARDIPEVLSSGE